MLILFPSYVNPMVCLGQEIVITSTPGILPPTSYCSGFSPSLPPNSLEPDLALSGYLIHAVGSHHPDL